MTGEAFAARVMAHFTGLLCPVYRKTFSEREISEKLAEFGKSLGLKVAVDGKSNVIMYKPGKSESADFPVIFQAHMDMVCVPVTADFSKGVTPYYPTSPNLMMGKSAADGTPTSLGADDGIGAAIILTILESNDITHPPIIALFTVEEENGMGGARYIDKEDIVNIAPHLDFDKAKFINVDDEKDGSFSVGCAGSVRGITRIPAKREKDTPDNMAIFQLQLSNFSGGHSGILIGEGRGNANKLLCEALRRLKYAGLDLSVFALAHCGDASNSIPLGASAVVGVPADQADKLEKSVAMLETIFKKRCKDTDPGLQVAALYKSGGIDAAPYTPETVNRLITMVDGLPDGVLTWSTDRAGLVETSSNLGTMQEEHGCIVITCMIRSSVDAMRDRVADDIERLGTRCNAGFERQNPSPGWAYKADNSLRDLFLEKYEGLFGDKGEAKPIHAGLECGHFASKLGNIDFIACGPTLDAVHSPDETLHIHTVSRLGMLLIEVLKDLEACFTR